MTRTRKPSTRGMRSKDKEKISAHVTFRLKQAKAGELIDPKKVAADGDFLIEAGNTLKEAVRIAETVQPTAPAEGNSSPLPSLDSLTEEQAELIKTYIGDLLAKKSGVKKRVSRKKVEAA